MMTGSGADADATRTVLITGSTDGLGRALALRLAASPGYRLLLHGRRPERLERVVAEMYAVNPDQVSLTFVANLADLGQVRRLAAEVSASVPQLDVLVSNAGIGFGEPDGVDRRTSVDGYELRFAVNHLAGLLLTLELLPLLERSRPARVVNVGSIGQNEIDLDDLMFEHGYDATVAYRRSKLAQVMCAMELASWIDPADVTFNTVHPATLMPTKIVTGAHVSSRDSIESGVAATIRLIDDPELTARSGLFFDGLSRATPHPQANDPSIRSELFRRCLQFVGRNGAQPLNPAEG